MKKYCLGRPSKENTPQIHDFGPSCMIWGHSRVIWECRIAVCKTRIRVAEIGSLSSKAKMAMEIFVKREITIFATNASFLRVTANLQV